MRLLAVSLSLSLLLVLARVAAAQSPSPGMCGEYACPICERAEPVCEPTAPLRINLGRVFDFLGTPLPDGPFGGEPLLQECRCECVWGSSPGAYCETPPTLEEDPYCPSAPLWSPGGPSECNPLVCDPSIDDIPASEWIDPLTGLPMGPAEPAWIPPRCLAATSPDDYWPECFPGQASPFANAQKAAKAMEQLVQLYPGGAAQAACEAQPGGAGRCHDGVYCGAASSTGAECVACDTTGACYRYRSLEGVTNTGPVAEDESNDQLGTVHLTYYDDYHSIEACTETACTGKLAYSTFLTDPSPDERRRFLKNEAFLALGYVSHVDPPPNEPFVPDEPIPTMHPGESPPPNNPRRDCLIEGGCRAHERTPAEKAAAAVGSEIGARKGDKTTGGRSKERTAQKDDPVALGSGAFFDSAVDLVVPAVPGSSLQFELVRSYSSQGITQGALGRNWTHRYEERIVPVNELYPGVIDVPHYCVAALPVVRCVVHEQEGDSTLYTQDPVTLAFIPPPGAHSAIARGIDAATRVVGWTLRDASGDEAVFDVEGRLRVRRDRNDNTMHFRYDEHGRLVAVVDPLQRIVRFAYDDNGLLERVTDHAGRTVEYGYEMVPPRTQLPETLQVAAGITRETIPGLFVTQWRLISVIRTAPATADAAAITEVWSYKWYPWEELPPPPAFYAPPEELCAEAPAGYAERVAYELSIDELIGNLIEVWAPDGEPVVYTWYQTDTTAPDFDRVLWQRYGEDVELDTTPAAQYEYRRDPATFPPEAVSWAAGSDLRVLAPGEGNCHDLWQHHAHRALISPVGSAAVMPWDASASALGEPTVSRVNPAELIYDLNAVCQFTRHTDRRSNTTWYGMSFTGQMLIAAQQVAGRDLVTVHELDVHGHVVTERAPSGRTVRRTYDVESANPLARGNLLDETEINTDGSTSRSRSWTYEPLFNQPYLMIDTLGRYTYRLVDYQEMGMVQGEMHVMEVLRAFGTAASSISQIAPAFWFIGWDVNQDGRADRAEGNVIYVWLPPTDTSMYSWMQYNALGQVTWQFLPEDASISYAYFPAETPHGGAVETTSVYLGEMTAARRVAREWTGGYLKGEHRTLQQAVGASAFGRESSTPHGVLYERDALGHVTVVRDYFGAEEHYGRDGNGEVVRVIDAEGYERRYGYDERRRLVAVAEGIEPGPVTIDGAEPARRTRIGWDGEDRIERECTELSSGACLLAGSPDAVATTYERDAEGNIQETTDPEGNVSYAFFDERGLPFYVTAGGGLEQRWLSYDDEGQVVAEWDGVSEQTSYEYDGFARVAAVRTPDGTVRRITYDDGDNARTEQVTDSFGAELSFRRYEHDDRDHLVEVGERWIVPGGQLSQPGWTAELVTRIETDAFGHPTRTIRPDGTVEERAWTWAGDLVAETDAAGNHSYHYRDPYTRTTLSRWVAEGSDRFVEVEHDRRGLAVATREHGAGTHRTGSTIYDGLGLAVETVDGVGNRNRVERDWLGRSVRSWTPRQQAGALDLVTETEYDRRGLVTRLRDPGHVETTRAYSASGRLVHELSGRQETVIDHDGAGRPSRIVRNGSIIDLWHWGGGRSTVVQAWDPVRQTWSGRYAARDGLGRMTYGYAYSSDATGWNMTVTERAFDSRGGLLSEESSIDGRASLRIRHARDTAGAVRATEYPDGSMVTRTVDAIGREVALDSPLGHFDLGWRASRVATIGAPRVTRSVSFDGLDRPIGVSNGQVFSETRLLDSAGRVQSQNQNWGPGGSWTRAFEYGGTGWLSAHTDAGTRYDLERDRAGTLLAEQSSSEVIFEAGTVTPEGHEYDWATLGGVDLEVDYDADGRVVHDRRADYEWDAFDQLIAATVRPSGERYRYLYDVFGRRVARALPSGAFETFVYDGWNRIATYRDATLVQQVVFGPQADQPLAVREGGATYYPVADVQGNVMSVVDSSGVTVELSAYDVFGGTLTYSPQTGAYCSDSVSESCQPMLDFGYNGQIRDPETGLYYYKHRYYDPRLRTFLSRDPMGFVDAYDPWLYAAGDGVNHTDPLGTDAIEDSLEDLGILGLGLDLGIDLAEKKYPPVTPRTFVNAIFEGRAAEHLHQSRQAGAVRSFGGAAETLTVIGYLAVGVSVLKAIDDPTAENITDAGMGAIVVPVFGLPAGLAYMGYKGIERSGAAEWIADRLYKASGREAADEDAQWVYWRAGHLKDPALRRNLRKMSPSVAAPMIMAEEAEERRKRDRRPPVIGAHLEVVPHEAVAPIEDGPRPVPGAPRANRSPGRPSH